MLNEMSVSMSCMKNIPLIYCQCKESLSDNTAEVEQFEKKYRWP